jgi:hypothetical protein
LRQAEEVCWNRHHQDYWVVPGAYQISEAVFVCRHGLLLVQVCLLALRHRRARLRDVDRRRGADLHLVWAHRLHRLGLGLDATQISVQAGLTFSDAVYGHLPNALGDQGGLAVDSSGALGDQGAAHSDALTVLDDLRVVCDLLTVLGDPHGVCDLLTVLGDPHAVCDLLTVLGDPHAVCDLLTVLGDPHGVCDLLTVLGVDCLDAQRCMLVLS